MDEILVSLIGFVLFAIIAVVVIFALLFIIGVVSGSSNPTSRNNVKQEPPHPEMNEGDFHSGPAGYSPNTAYPDTFYGSGMDDEGDWRQ
jgi:NADH:ubiquinone oxidoreductase subunit 3 (subunit A)